MPSTIRKIPRKATKKRSPRATVVTIHHPPHIHPLQGSEERAMLLRHRALQLKIQGRQLLDISAILKREFELVDGPSKTTVYEWIETALMEGLKDNKREAVNYVNLFRARSEASIAALIPFALDAFVVERTKMIDGVEVKVVDEDTFNERLKAIAEIRKQGESVLKAMGVTRPDQAAQQVTGDSIQTFILQTVNNHIAKGGEIIDANRQQTVLELSSGSPVVDGL